MKIPFDSLSLAAVVCECKPLVGGRLERIVQWDDLTIGLGVFHVREEWILISADARYARAHLVSRRRGDSKNPPPFCMSLRKYLSDATVVSIVQRGLDRILDISLASEGGGFLLVAELMGKHSNIVLCDGGGTVLVSAKVVGLGKSKRPIVPGRPYLPPPFEARPSLLEAQVGADLSEYEGASPFLQSLVAGGLSLSLVQSCVKGGHWEPVYVHGSGAYPLPLANGVRRDSISQALEQHFDAVVDADQLSAEKSSLGAQLERVRKARTKALSEIETALDSAVRARSRQEQAELVLAYQSAIPVGASSFETVDYEGNAIVIFLDPTLSAVENANKMFERAKRAKKGAAEAAMSKENLLRDKAEVEKALVLLESASTLAGVGDVRLIAGERRWLHQHGAAKAKEDRPYEGHSIKEALSPNGWKVLFGENATSNDYLTTKVARPNDYWFHVRGVTSAHVVLLTQNRPTSVQMEDLLFAARIAVGKSASKHASYVTVDYLLKKHVRKPRKSAPGAVTYSQEKTLHVEK